MSGSKPNWVDYANLALNVAQNVQLQQLHSTLGTLASLEAERALLEQNEQQARVREDWLRDFMWKLETSFEGLISSSSTNPCAVFFGAWQVQQAMGHCGFTSACFRQLGDKDRLGAFQKRLQQALQESTAKMSSAERADLETYLDYISEAEELDGLVRRLEADEKDRSQRLVSAEERKRKASNKLARLRQDASSTNHERDEIWKDQKRTLAKIGLVLASVLTVLGWVISVTLLGIPAYDLLNGDNTQNDGRLFFAGFAAVAISLAGTAICAVLRKKSLPTKRIRDKIAELEGRIKGIGDEIEYFQASPHESGLEKFGVQSIEELREQQRDRNSFILQFARQTGLPASPQAGNQILK